MVPTDVDVVVLGAGTAGILAFREVLTHTDRVCIVDGGHLGTTCAHVGCMPSKLLIAAAERRYAIDTSAAVGICVGSINIDGPLVMQRLRNQRDQFSQYAINSLESLAGDKLIREDASFLDDHTLRLTSGRTLTAKTFVLAVGSRPHVPDMLREAGDRLVINDDIFEWDQLPDRIAIFGAGPIGLEIGQALHRLGVDVHFFVRGKTPGLLQDSPLQETAQVLLESDLTFHYEAETTLTKKDNAVRIVWQDTNGSDEADFDYIFAATGRRSNLDQISLDNTRLADLETPVPRYDPNTMQVADSHFFIAGDASEEDATLHEAADEGRLAGENAALYPRLQPRVRRTPLKIVFTDPQIGLAGLTAKQLINSNIAFATGEASFSGQGRAVINLVNAGTLCIHGERETGRLLGAEIVGPDAEHLIHLLAWAIENCMTVENALLSPVYHPVLEEAVRTALRRLNKALGFNPAPPLSQLPSTEN